MLKFLKKEANMTHTENGAVTYRSTQSECLDLFATIGALRRERDEEITNRFLRAYAEDADLAMKTLFFARDIRGGIGERRVFRTILKWLADNEPQSLEKNIQYIAEYGRYDDLLVLMGTTCEGKVLHLIKKQLAADFAALEAGESVSLLAPLRQCLQRRCDPAGEANCPCDGYERRPVPQNAERPAHQDQHHREQPARKRLHLRLLQAALQGHVQVS